PGRPAAPDYRAAHPRPRDGLTRGQRLQPAHERRRPACPCSQRAEGRPLPRARRGLYRHQRLRHHHHPQQHPRIQQRSGGSLMTALPATTRDLSAADDSRAISLAPPRAVRNIVTIASRELREAVRSRWFLLYTIAFAGLGLGVSYVSAMATGGVGLSGFGRTTAGLINLVLLVVPLMGLTAGAGAIASDRERGMLAYLLAQPVSRFETILGKYLGLGAALLACICLGL